MKARHLELEQHDGIRRHFEFDWQDVGRCNPAYAAFVEGERARLGEAHPLFQSQYCLRPLTGGGRLFTPAQLTLLEGNHTRERGPAHLSGLLGYVAGLDVGGEVFEGNRQSAVGSGRRDADATVLTIARVLASKTQDPTPDPGIEIVEHLAWQGAPHTELIAQLGRLLRDHWRVRRLVVDATGLGEGLAASLAALRGGPEVVRLRLGEANKSRLGYALLAAVNAGRLTLYQDDGSPEARTVRRECARARATYRPNRTLAYAVDAADGHDDYLLSLAFVVEAAGGLTPRAARGRIEEERKVVRPGVVRAIQVIGPASGAHGSGPHPPAPSPNTGRGGASASGSGRDLPASLSGVVHPLRPTPPVLPLSQYWERGSGGEGRSLNGGGGSP